MTKMNWRAVLVSAAVGMFLVGVAARAQNPAGEDRLTDGGFEGLKAGTITAPIGPNVWGMTGVVAVCKADQVSAHSGQLGIAITVKQEAAGAGGGIGQIVTNMAPGIYELSVAARGAGDILLHANAEKRCLALTTNWNVYTLIFEVQQVGSLRVELLGTIQVELDDVSLKVAAPERQMAWHKQEAARIQYGFVPAGMDAQQPAVAGKTPVWTPPSEGVVWKEKVVFYDEECDPAWSTNPKTLADYLALNEFKILDADALGQWMEKKVKAGAPDTVVVMSMGVAPMTVLQTRASRDSTLFKYLQAGGRVLWVGEFPFYYNYNTKSFAPEPEAPRTTEVLGLGGGPYTPISSSKGPSQLTKLGQRWGLTVAGYDCIPIGVTADSVTAVLAGYHSPAVDQDAALSWFKNYEPTHPWSGLVFALRNVDFNQPAFLKEAYRMALFAGTPVTAPEPTLAKAVTPSMLVLHLAPPHDRTCYLRGETIPINVETKTNQTDVPVWERLDFMLMQGKIVCTKHTVSAGQMTVWNLTTDDWACGDYRLRVVATAAGREIATAEQTISICPRRPDPTFFYGVMQVGAGNPRRMVRLLERLRDLGMHAGGPGSSAFNDLALKYGRRVSLRFDVSPNGPGYPPSELQKDAAGKVQSWAWTPNSPTVSLLSPELRRRGGEEVIKQILGIQGYPSVWPFGHALDDYSGIYWYDYSDLAIAEFKKDTGLDVPRTPTAKPGIVPENDPWLQWRLFHVRNVNGGFNRALTDAAEKAWPGIRVGPIPGGMQMPLFQVGQYPPLQFGAKGFNLLNYYYYLLYWQPQIGCLYWDEVARMGNRDLPLWCMPGFYEAQNEPTYNRNEIFLHLAGGVQGLNYFTQGDGEARPRVIAEAGRIGREIMDPYYPLLGKLRSQRHTVGLLLPFTQAIYQDDRYYSATAVYVYANLLAAHLDVEPMCEEEVIANDVPYRAILLWNVQWLRQAAVDGLQRFIARGGKVLCDQSTTVQVPGATRLPVDLATGKTEQTKLTDDPRFSTPGIGGYAHPVSIANVKAAVSTYTMPMVDSPATDLIIREAQAGGTRYLWLVNIHTREDYLYLRQRVGAGVKPADPVKARAEAIAYLDQRAAANGGVYKADVNMATGKVGALYDVLQGKAIPFRREGERLLFTATMKPFGGQLVAIYPRAVSKVRIDAGRKVARGGTLDVTVTVLDASGKPATGCHPIGVAVTTPTGPSVEWTWSDVTTNGVLRIAIHPARNDPPGEWHLTVTERSSGVNGQVKFVVR